MKNHGKERTTTKPKPENRAVTIGAAWSGYTDKLAGKGFSREYETACVNYQRNYELGRIWATAMQRHGNLVAWKSPARMPAAFLAAAGEACRIGGVRASPQ